MRRMPTSKVNAVSKVRPYWHVDLKWAFGLIAVLLVTLTLLFAGFARATAKKTATTAIATATALLFSQNGLDAGDDIQQLRDMIKASPKKSIGLVPGINITVTADDLKGATPREIRINIFQKIADPIYEGGSAGLTQLITDPSLRSLFSNAAFMFFTKASHDGWQITALVLGLIALLPLATASLFSRRVGRIVTPAVIILTAALPLAVVLIILTSAFAVSGAVTAKVAPPDFLTSVFSQVLPALLRIVSSVFTLALIVSAALFLAAIVGRIILAVRNQARR